MTTRFVRRAGRARTPRPAAITALAVGLALAAACGASSEARSPAPPLLVGAASDLRPAFTVLGDAFEEETGQEVVFTFGSSGQLAQQLAEGAPMDVYASANAAFVDRVLDTGVGDPATRATYAVGRLVLWSPRDRWGDWDDLAAVADDPEVRSVAIANPDHAPYGQAARQALEAAGVWDRLRPSLVYGQNVTDTQRLAASGNADVAIVALSLALASDERDEGRWALVDDDLHAPLEQDLLVVADEPARAELAGRFVALVTGDEGREVMRRFGLLLPGEDPPASWGR